MTNYENKEIDAFAQEIKECFRQKDYQGVRYHYQEADDQMRNALAYEFGYSFLQTRSGGTSTMERCKEIGKAFGISQYDARLRNDILNLKIDSLDFYGCCSKLIEESDEESVSQEEKLEMIRLGFNCLLIDYYRDPDAFFAFCNDGMLFFLKVNVAAVLNNLIQNEWYPKAVAFLNSFSCHRDFYIKVIDSLFFLLKASRGADSWIKMAIFLHQLKEEPLDRMPEDSLTFIDSKCSECVEAITDYMVNLKNGEEHEQEAERLKKYTEHLNQLIDEPLNKLGRDEVDHFLVEEANVIKVCLEKFEKEEYGLVLEHILKSFPKGLDKARHSVIDYFELSVIKIYEETGDTVYLSEALKYYPESERLKEILLRG